MDAVPEMTAPRSKPGRLAYVGKASRLTSSSAAAFPFGGPSFHFVRRGVGTMRPLKGDLEPVVDAPCWGGGHGRASYACLTALEHPFFLSHPRHRCPSSSLTEGAAAMVALLAK
jgi:hypothetical protein